MKLSFSTRGRLQTPWATLCELAADNGFAGIEVYDAYKDPALTGASGALHKYNCAATLRSLRDRGLAIPVFDSSCNVGFGDADTGTFTTQISEDQLLLKGEYHCGSSVSCCLD